MSTLTTGLAGQQQARPARGGSPDQPAWSSAALSALLAPRRGNLIATQPAADDLERAGVAALRLALNDAGWPAPQDHRPAISGLIQILAPASLMLVPLGKSPEYAPSAARSPPECCPNHPALDSAHLNCGPPGPSRDRSGHGGARRRPGFRGCRRRKGRTARLRQGR